MATPLVSVLIDTYNHERFIEQAIVSVLEQDAVPADTEIIVVDDGSTDGTPGIIQKFRPRVRYLRKENGGQASAFNAGIPETHGEFVAFLDGDDWWLKPKLRRVLEAFEADPEVGTVGHGYYEIDSASSPHRVVVPDRDYKLDFRDVASARLASQMSCFLGTSRFTTRATLLRKILPFPEELVVEADEYMFTLAFALAPVKILGVPLFNYRLHDGNLFMIQEHDLPRLRRKQQVLEVLLHTLPAALKRFGVSEEVASTALAYTRIDATRMRLSQEGGKPWETFAVERHAYALSYAASGLGYQMFQSMVLALTLVMPPRRFYSVRRWYSARGLRKVRGVLGEPVAVSPAIQTAVESGK